MKLSKLSCVLILIVSGLLLSAESLKANENQNQESNQNSAGSEIDSPPVQKPASGHKKAGRQQRGTKENPLVVDVITPQKTDAETSQIQKDHDEKLSLDRQTINLTKETVRLNGEMTKFTGYLAGLAFFQFLVLVAQACILWRQTGFNRDQTSNQRVIERAYVKVSHVPPGISFSPNEVLRVRMRVKNFGRTPAKVTAEVTSFHLGDDGDPLPLPEEVFSSLPVRPMEAFLVEGDEFYFTQPKPFDEPLSQLIQSGRKRLLVYSYIDYIDQFGERHRAGYARQYNSGLDIKSNYATPEDYRERNNLDLLTEPGYNYDRPRKQNEGHDWNEPV